MGLDDVIIKIEIICSISCTQMHGLNKKKCLSTEVAQEIDGADVNALPEK
jgi:hypothetical protein